MTTTSTLATSPVSAVLPAADTARAKDFYERVVGLEVESGPGQGYAYVHAGDGTRFLIYQTPLAPTEATTLAFKVADLKAVAAELRARGLAFEEYDMPGLKTVDGIAEFGDGSMGAWFKDSEGNTVNVVQM